MGESKAVGNEHICIYYIYMVIKLFGTTHTNTNIKHITFNRYQIH